MNKLKVLASLILLMMLCSFSTASKAADSAAVLELAERAGRWISGTAIPTDTGTAWPDDALSPEITGHDLAAGMSGKVVFFIALYRATGKARYLNEARLGADYLVSIVDSPEQFDGNQRRASLYAGIAGIGVALMHVTSETSESRYELALRKVLSLLNKWSLVDGNSRHWSDQFNDLIYGDAGTVLFLAHLAQTSGNQDSLTMAKQGGHFLLSQAGQSEKGSHWLFRRDKEFNLPNFSHGTAGIAYVLATTGRLANDEALISGARSGFNYIASIIENDNGMIRIPYGWGADAWNGLYQFGWAHGLTGTANLFERIRQSDIEANAASSLLASTRTTLLSINLPDTPSEPFTEPATPLDLRFGRASVLSLFSAWSTRYPDDKAITALRDALYTQIASVAVRENDTAHWPVDAPAFMGGGRAAFTGLFHGAAGIGLALLRMHANLIGHSRYDDLPDYPF